MSGRPAPRSTGASRRDLFAVEVAGLGVDVGDDVGRVEGVDVDDCRRRLIRRQRGDHLSAAPRDQKVRGAGAEAIARELVRIELGSCE